MECIRLRCLSNIDNRFVAASLFMIQRSSFLLPQNLYRARIYTNETI